MAMDVKNKRVLVVGASGAWASEVHGSKMRGH